MKNTVCYKKLKGKGVPLCDYDGKCVNKAYREVYPFLMKGKQKNKGWSYLCRKHFKQEQEKFKGKLPSCNVSKNLIGSLNWRK